MLNLLKAVRLPTKASLGLLALRLVCGFAFMHHGWGKIQKPLGWMGEGSWAPGFLQALAALSEFGGGLAWMLGFLTPVASAGLAVTMTVATYTHMIVRGDPFVGRAGSYELASIFLAVSLLLLLAGPGRFSVDRLVFGEKGQ